MKRLVWSIALLVIVVGFAASTNAQERDSGPNRDEVEGMMDAYILSKLQDALELTDEQFGTMVVAQKKLQDTRRDYRQGRMTLLRRMRQTLRRDQAREEELTRLLDELDNLEIEFSQNQRARYAAIDDILEIRQSARYRILEAEIQRRLTQLMRQVRGRRDPPRPFE
ncbi:MAG: hypothetical protein E2P02_12295 [Acidobacteria bacterium]|nr:MAG: hypothetical protein E2P02_12295 [Acidobacteriota bacterium]